MGDVMQKISHLTYRAIVEQNDIMKQWLKAGLTNPPDMARLEDSGTEQDVLDLYNAGMWILNQSDIVASERREGATDV